MKPTIKGLMLAAGSSSRMGSPKQLLPWGESTLIEHCISVAKQSQLDSLLLALGSDATAIRQSIQVLDIDIVVNEEWAKGIASTIKIGVDRLILGDTPDGILIMLADQPFISSADLDALIEAFESSDSVIASNYKHRLGVPALFGASHFDLLTKLIGDKGAGSILNTMKDSTRTLPIAIDLTDIDTMETYTALRPNTNG